MIIMRKLIRLRQHIYWIAAILLLSGIVSCKKDKEPGSKSIEVNISFSSFIQPVTGQTLVANLYYDDVTGTSIINSTPDLQIKTVLSFDNIANGFTITFEDVPADADYVYICAYIDINENAILDAGDLAVFYDNVNLEYVELNQATPTNLAGIYSIDLDINIIYALDELVIDIDNNIYKTVVIGDQEWFAENLKTTKFRNGENIPTGHTAEEWVALMNPDDGTGSPAYAQNPEAIPEDGLLYNWFAVTDDREICPDGWRSPTDDDWKELMSYAGMPSEEVDLFNTWYGADAGVGTKLKSTTRDMNGTDVYGFNAIPSGMRSGAGTYSRYGLDFFFWSATEDPRVGEIETYYLNGVRRALRNSETGVIRQGNTKLGGYAVRCVRDVQK